MAFKDHFSRQAVDYRRYRPGYPPELIEFIAAQAPDRRLAIDCATGNGQAAVALAAHFDAVVALDGSVSQLRNAAAHRGVWFVRISEAAVGKPFGVARGAAQAALVRLRAFPRRVPSSARAGRRGRGVDVREVPAG
jgi:hypothetical protein